MWLVGGGEKDRKEKKKRKEGTEISYGTARREE